MQDIKGTANTPNMFLHDMGIDFSGLNIGMHYQFLNQANIDPIFEHMGGKTMPLIPISA